jgi:hypothetical protein
MPKNAEVKGKKGKGGDPETRTFLATLGLVEWAEAFNAAKRLLIALDAPPVAPEAQERPQKVIRYHGEAHATLLIRTITESEGNELALIEPVIGAVSQVMTWKPQWADKGLAWIEAFDHLPLLQIVDAMRSLTLFKESSLGGYLANVLHNKLLSVFELPPSPPKAKRPYRRRRPGEPPAKRERKPLSPKGPGGQVRTLPRCAGSRVCE